MYNIADHLVMKTALLAQLNEILPADEHGHKS